MQHDLISTRYKLQIMRGRGIQNGKINWFVLNLMDKEILQLAMTQIDEKLLCGIKIQYFMLLKLSLQIDYQTNFYIK